MTAIIGPNGAGKSTFLKGALGIVPRLSGEVRIFGKLFEDARDRVPMFRSAPVSIGISRRASSMLS